MSRSVWAGFNSAWSTTSMGELLQFLPCTTYSQLSSVSDVGGDPPVVNPILPTQSTVTCSILLPNWVELGWVRVDPESVLLGIVYFVSWQSAIDYWLLPNNWQSVVSRVCVVGPPVLLAVKCLVFCPQDRWPPWTALGWQELPPRPDTTCQKTEGRMVIGNPQSLWALLANKNRKEHSKSAKTKLSTGNGTKHGLSNFTLNKFQSIDTVSPRTC